NHLLRRINPIVTRVLADLSEKLALFYSDIGRPSIDPELMIRMLIVGYCYGVRFERRLCQEVELHLAYRWFCRLDLDDKIPDHSTFSVNRHGRFRDSDILRHVFEAVVRACMDAGLVKGDGFAAPPSQSQRTPNRGGSCPNGYLASGSYCVPSAAAPTRGTRLAKPPNGQCPWGWLASRNRGLVRGRWCGPGWVRS